MPHTPLVNEMARFEIRHLSLKDSLIVNLPLIESAYFTNNNDISTICFQFIGGFIKIKLINNKL